MDRKEFTGSIQISYTEDNYGGGESSASGEIVLPAPQLPDGISISYSGDYLGSIIPQMLKDIKAYLEDPSDYIQDYIQKGPDNWEKLRQLEQELQENLSDAEKYRRYATQHEQYAQGKRQQIEALKKRIESTEG